MSHASSWDSFETVGQEYTHLIYRLSVRWKDLHSTLVRITVCNYISNFDGGFKGLHPGASVDTLGEEELDAYFSNRLA